MSIGDPCDPSSPNYNPAQCTTDGCTPGASRDECGECVGGNTGKTAKLWYQDLDGDGWGNNAVAKFCANPGSGWADKGGDWNDDCNNTANRSDQCLTYNEFTPYNDPYIGNQQGSDDTFSNLNNPVDVNDVNEIQIGIDLAEPDLIVPAGNPILLGFTADRNPPGGVNASEDMQHGYNGDVTGIWPKFLNTSMYTESEMWRSMSHLVSTCSFLDSDMKAVGAKMIKKFHDREGGQFSDPTLNSRVYSSIQFKNFMKQFGSALKQKLVQANGDIHAISTIDMASVRPTFGGLYNKFHGLQILIHDTQKTDVFLEKYTTLGNIWTATVEVVIHDNFGLDLHDAVTYQDKHDGFPCWYMLQHRYNYLPFETIVRVRLNISSTF